MAGKLIQNEETGVWGLWDGEKITELPGKVVTHEKTGAKALWDGKTLTPIKVDLDLSQPGAEQDKAKIDAALTPQQLEAKTSPTGFAQPPAVQSPMQVMETINAPIEAGATAAGRYVQNKVEPILGGTASDVAGALTKEGLQYLGPQAVGTGLRLGAKALTRFAPGRQGGLLDSLLSKTSNVLAAGQSKAALNERELSGLVKKIPISSEAPLPNTLKKADEIIAYHQAHDLSSPVLADAKRLKGLIEKSGTRSIQWIDHELTDIGEKTKAVLGQRADPRYKELFASLASDLENTAKVKLGTFTEWGKPSISKIGEPASKGTTTGGTYTDWGKPSVRMIGAKESVTTQPKPSWQTYDIKTTKPGVQTPVIQWGTPKQVEIRNEAFFPSSETTVMKYGQPKQVERIAQQTGKTDLRYLQDPQIAARGEVAHGELVRIKDEAIRRRKGFDDVIKEFNNMVMVKRGTEGAKDINAPRLMDKLQRKQFLQESLNPEDWKEIEPILAKLADTAALPPGKGASYGSGRALARGAVAGTAAWMLGGNPLVWSGGVTALDYSVGQLLMKSQGRQLVKTILEMDSYSSSQKFNILNGLGRLAEKGVNAVRSPNEKTK